MKADQIMDALGHVKEEYIMEAAPGRQKNRKRHAGWIAAAAALVVLFAFFQTAPGAAALEAVKETVTNLIETLFPPREIAVIVEGETEVKQQEAGGREPETREDGTVYVPGFAIYYDTELYTMSEENGVTYIRFATDSDLPPCEVEIRHMPGLNPEDAAKAVREEMTADWEYVSEIRTLETGEGLAFSFAAGANWDAACGDVFFLSDGRDGCFRIISRYFMEATEGHGVRFGQMVRTFEIIDP